MATIAESTISDFLDALASGNSTPGGGGAAALTGSQAAALLSMVINFTVGRPKYAEVEEEMQSYLQHAEALRGELYMFINKDAEAFEAVSACYGMPRSTDEENRRARRRCNRPCAGPPRSLPGGRAVPGHLADGETGGGEGQRQRGERRRHRRAPGLRRPA
ncbi:MAG: cyclodeaminase/cyclohydrolase family protein [Caldilineaceae bacterium]